MIRKRKHVAEKCAAWGVPSHMVGGIERYLFDGIKPGDFMRAVLNNNLMEAVRRADPQNIECLRGWVSMLYHDFPVGSYGQPGSVDFWTARIAKEKGDD